MSNYKFHRGFTLFEILAVVAIFAMLAAIIVPVVGKAMESGRKSVVANNLRQIALAYYNWINTGGQRGGSEGTLHDFVGIFAEEADLNNPEIWIIKEDPLVEGFSGKMPSHIGYLSKELGKWELNEAFRDFPLSIVLVKGISANAHLSSTPVVWTRGLRVDGKWSGLGEVKPGVYGDKGGFIGFLDGHVRWYRDLSENGGMLTHYITRRPTSNIFEAIPPHAFVLD